MSKVFCRTVYLVLFLALACDDGNSNGSSCKNPHEALTAGEPKQLSPENTHCVGSTDTSCEAKDEDVTILLAEDHSFFVAWLSNRTDGNDDIYIVRSTDGITWSDPVRVTSSADADWFPTLVEFPTARGRFHLSWMRQQISAPFERHIFFNSSEDGLTWDSANEVQVTTGAVDDFLPYLYVHNGNFHIYFDNLVGRSSSGTRDLFLSRSTDGGATWEAPQELTTANSTTEMDSFPYVVQRPFSNSLMMLWIRYNASATGMAGYLDPSSDLVFATSDDGISWSPAFPVTTDNPDTTVDTIPSVYNTGDKEIFTWMQGVNNEPHLMEIPLTFPSTYPTGLIDLSAANSKTGYSPRVVKTLKDKTYIRTFVSADKKIFYQVFER
jgi:hypothetical protein